MTPRKWGALGGLLVAGSLVAFGGCWGSEYNKVEGLEGSGGQGGQGGQPGGGGSGGSTGGSTGDCEPFTGQAPDDCEAGMLEDADNCCVSGRSCLGGSCDAGQCQSVHLGDSFEGEAIGIVTVGDLVVWTSGWGHLILSVPKAGGLVSLVHDHGEICTTALATDGERVFWVEYDGTQVWSVDPAVGGPAQLVADTDTAGGWGRIDVHGEWVFWVAESLDEPPAGSVWMAAKDGSDHADPIQIHDSGQPHGVAADDTHVYWTDRTDGMGGVYRLPIAGVLAGNAGPPELFGSSDNYPGDVVVADGEVYWSDGGNVLSRSTSGGAETPVGSSGGQVWALALDQSHIYWSDEMQNLIYRARRDGGDVGWISVAVGPKGVAVDCDAVYFANYTDQDPDYVSKVAK